MSDRRDVDSLSQLRVGLNIIDLRRARHGLAPHTLGAMDDMLDRLAAACRNHVAGPLPPDLLARIDTALSEAVNEPADDVREDALIGLVESGAACFQMRLLISRKPRSPGGSSHEI